ncbi:MAG: hypothetical protein K2K39_02170 [Clostridia bacterium]|nr:hypothetical protein [Clostridia bacterium]
MEFKHAFHVFVDNFSTTYKLLVYRLIVLAVTAGLCCAVIIPTVNSLQSTVQYETLNRTLTALWDNIIKLNMNELHTSVDEVISAADSFKNLLMADKSWLVGLASFFLTLIYLIDRFLVGIGNYVTGALVNDRMVMHANSSFTITLFKNLKKAVLYNLIYAPLAIIYDFLCITIIWAVIFVGLKFVPIALVKIFLVAVIIILFSAVKFTFTTDWLPSLIHSKMNNRKAIVNTFSRKGKKTGTVLSNTLVIKLIIIAINIAAAIFTVGAGLLVTLPATALMQISFSFVNYFDANKQKYFVDEYTVIGPKKEKPTSREEFFKGED